MTIDFYRWDNIATNTLLYPKLLQSLPLDCPRRLTRHIVGHTIDARHLVHDAVLR